MISSHKVRYLSICDLSFVFFFESIFVFNDFVFVLGIIFDYGACKVMCSADEMSGKIPFMIDEREEKRPVSCIQKSRIHPEIFNV